MKTLYIIILTLLTISMSYSRDSTIVIQSHSYSNARSTASQLAASQGLYIVGQNYRVDHNNNWTVIFKLRERK
jgi:hypothetical protein